MSIVIRHAEPGDFEAVQSIFEAPEAIAGTLQVPFPSAEAWRKLLAEQQPGGKILLATIDGRVVGQIGFHAVARPRRSTSAISAWRSTTNGITRASDRHSCRRLFLSPTIGFTCCGSNSRSIPITRWRSVYTRSTDSLSRAPIGPMRFVTENTWTPTRWPVFIRTRPTSHRAGPLASVALRQAEDDLIADCRQSADPTAANGGCRAARRSQSPAWLHHGDRGACRAHRQTVRAARALRRGGRS